MNFSLRGALSLLVTMCLFTLSATPMEGAPARRGHRGQRVSPSIKEKVLPKSEESRPSGASQKRSVSSENKKESAVACDPVFERLALGTIVGRSCESDSSSGVFRNISRAVGGLQAKPKKISAEELSIPPQCIHQSMLLTPNSLGSSFFRMYRCSSDEQPVSQAKRIYRPCDENLQLSEHIAQIMSHAMRCLNSLGGAKISGEEIFKQINHESHFTPTVQNFGGIGIMQLTSDAAKEMHRANSAADRYRREMKGKPECEVFSSQPGLIENHDLILSAGRRMSFTSGKISAGEVNACQFLTPYANPSRSILYGLTLYKQFKTEAERVVSESLPLLKEVHLGDKASVDEFITELARFSYNLGQSNSKTAWLRYVNQLQKYRSKIKTIQVVAQPPAAEKPPEATGYFDWLTKYFRGQSDIHEKKNEMATELKPDKEEKAILFGLFSFMYEDQKREPDLQEDGETPPPTLLPSEYLEKAKNKRPEITEEYVSRLLVRLRHHFKGLPIRYGDKKYTTKIDKSFDELQSAIKNKDFKCFPTSR